MRVMPPKGLNKYRSRFLILAQTESTRAKGPARQGAQSWRIENEAESDLQGHSKTETQESKCREQITESDASRSSEALETVHIPEAMSQSERAVIGKMIGADGRCVADKRLWQIYS